MAGSCKIDFAFKSGIQSAYWPGRDRSIDSSWSLFKDRGCTRIRDLAKYALDHVPIVEAAQIAAQARETHTAGNPRPSAWENVQAAIDEVTALTDGRGKPFYALGWKLEAYGLDWDEIETILRDVAGSDPKMQKRLAKNMRDYRSGLASWKSTCHSKNRQTEGAGEMTQVE